MIRILHSVSNMDRAGIETMLMNYYRNIDRNEIQFDFLCNKKKIGDYDGEIKKMGGRIYRTPGLNPLKFFKYKKYMKKLFETHPEYKIIHAHNGPFAVYSLYCAKKANIPTRIFHGHNTGFPIDIKLPLKLFCKSRIKFCITEKWACGKEAVKFYFGNKTYKNGDFKIIHNAIDIQKFTFNSEIRNRIRNEYDLIDKTVIGHVGRFSPIKNHSFIIKLFEKYSHKNENSVLILIGDGEDKNKIHDLVVKNGLSEKVLFLGNISNVNEWYQAFDLFILPSINEGLPVVGVEAQAAGLPCLFSSTVPNEIDITHNCRFLSLSDSMESWCNEMSNILKSTVRKNVDKLIVSGGYDIKNECKKIVGLYRDFYK